VNKHDGIRGYTSAHPVDSGRVVSVLLYISTPISLGIIFDTCQLLFFKSILSAMTDHPTVLCNTVETLSTANASHESI